MTSVLRNCSVCPPVWGSCGHAGCPPVSKKQIYIKPMYQGFLDPWIRHYRGNWYAQEKFLITYLVWIWFFCLVLFYKSDPVFQKWSWQFTYVSPTVLSKIINKIHCVLMFERVTRIGWWWCRVADSCHLMRIHMRIFTSTDPGPEILLKCVLRFFFL